MMTRDSQKEHERRLLHAFMDLVGLTNRVKDVEEGEGPDFRFTLDGARIGTEITEYHDPQAVNEEGVHRRTVEARWDELQDALTDSRPEDLEGFLLHLSFEELRLPTPEERGDFIGQLHEALRKRIEEINNGGCRFRPDSDYSPLLEEYVRIVDVRPVTAWSQPHSNIQADAVGTDEARLLKALTSKLTADSPEGLAECWLVVHTGWRISQMTGWMFVEHLENYDSLNQLIEQSPYDRLYFVEAENERVFLWCRNEGWTIKVGTRYPHGDEPGEEVDVAE